MQDYNVQRCTRRCQKSDRPLEPGERFYSVVITHGNDLQRIDFAEKEWSGPPEGAIGWWRGRMPLPEAKTRKPTPNHVLIETLADLCEQPEESQLAYLLGVLLVRRRLLVESHDDEPDKDDTYMHLVHPSDGREFWVPSTPPSADQLDEIQQALDEMLYREE